MHEAARVDLLERRGEPRAEADRVRHRERSVLVQVLTEVSAVEPLHREKLPAALERVRDVRDDAGDRPEVREHARFHHEARLVLGLHGAKHLHRDDARRSAIACAEDGAHAAGANLFDQLEAVAE